MCNDRDSFLCIYIYMYIYILMWVGCACMVLNVVDPACTCFMSPKNRGDLFYDIISPLFHAYD
jgi:hypothetical protein